MVNKNFWTIFVDFATATLTDVSTSWQDELIINN